MRFEHVCSWSGLLAAYRAAARGKRSRRTTAGFEHRVADRLLQLQRELRDAHYKPDAYVDFVIHDPKRRKISAAPFRDRVVHHALCAVMEPAFERRFIVDSYANRLGKGTHRAVDRIQEFCRRYTYVLRVDIVQHFASIDHEVLRRTLAAVVDDEQMLWLIDRILASGDRILEDQYDMVYFPGDDLFATTRPRGLPIGNLTPQFWSNCYLNPFDHFVKRELRCPAYLRYVDDFALFSNSKRELASWRTAVVERLARYRLVLHETAAQVQPVAQGIPWLGFIVFPTHRRVKGRNVRNFRRRSQSRWEAHCRGEISFAEFDATVRGWVNHVRFADTWGLRRSVLGKALVRRSKESDRSG